MIADAMFANHISRNNIGVNFEQSRLILTMSFSLDIILKICWLLFSWNENVPGVYKYCIIFTNWRTPNPNRRLAKHFWDKNPWELYGINQNQHF